MGKMEEHPHRARNSISPGYGEMICIILIIVLGALFGYDRYLAPKVIAFDIKGYLREQKALLAGGEITEEQWKQGFDTLERVLREQPERHLIILKDVVLKHGSEPELIIK